MQFSNSNSNGSGHPSGIYVPGGRNVVSDRYDTGGYLKFSDKARWLGELSGTWYEIGLAIGGQCSDMIAASTDYWWESMCQSKGLEATISAMDAYIRQVDMLDPTQLELLHGITDGAADKLAGAKYGTADSPYFADAFYRVFAASIFDCWLWGDPDARRGSAAEANNSAEGYINGDGCNSVAVKGSATADGSTLSSQVRHTQQAGLCYQASLAYHGNDCYTVWTVGNVPAPNGLLLVNSCGVSISHHFGGSTTQASLAAAAAPCYGSAYGVPWPNLLFFAAKKAATAEEALDILKHGSARYRQISGRDTVLRDGTWNWMVCDENTLSVIEVSPDRYAVRYAGEYTGADWTDPDYIACANHFICPFSYDEHDTLTDIPMTVFNNNSNSEARFWTLMWELKTFRGSIDVYTLQYIFSQTYLRDRESGAYIYAMEDTDGKLLTAGQAFGCVQGKLIDNGFAKGTNGAKIAVLKKGFSSCYFCLGNPKDWQGEWDLFRFQ